ncbi:hypothetical protein BU25DRAFT_456052 [Macroventuria anomochaeta]|uniref:Uncharacterized protein n=1 Tax=Macroventuria anomochaeta TaxID=301207 RepID=A0ACB6S9N8_9PLEO|nr:uncharacterized protein BU25DRAFT_456052 [Macroventuria anomochaeta]KAF2630295.1 hypothetical protein BU25DRAFT_456052 [Macroventuria anomochaeta]
MTASSSSTIAFCDFQHTWLSEGPLLNQLDIRSKPLDPRAPVDLVRLSQIGGHDITFSGDGKIFWLLGSSLNFADVRQLIKNCYAVSLESRDSGFCAQPHVRSLELNVTYETALSRQASETGGKIFPVTDATLVAMSDRLPRVLQYGTMIIRNGQI